ncbi:hypothetical protein D3C72_1511100 [compost metagenome]
MNTAVSIRKTVTVQKAMPRTRPAAVNTLYWLVPQIMPAMTVAMTPETWSRSARMYAAQETNSADVMTRYSSCRRRPINTQATPTAVPIAAPPKASTAKLPRACVVLNAPVMAAATAKRKSTSPVASLSRLSPSNSISTRRGSLTCCSTARAETASGGETIAPNAAHAAHGNEGNSQCVTTATTKVVKSTAPTANEVMPMMCLRR